MDERTEILFIGIGGAGCRILDVLYRASPADPPHALAVHTDAGLLESLSIPRRLVLGGEAAEGIRTGGDPEAGRRAAVASEETVETLCAKARVAVLITGLGGGTGTGAAPYLARRIRDAGALVLVFATLPFFFEGAQRRKRAEKALRALRESADAVLAFPNQRLFDLFGSADPADHVFETAGRMAGETLLALSWILEGRGLIRLDAADLRAMIRTRGGTLAIAGSSAQGENRVADAVDALAGSPLLEQGHILAASREVLVGMVGGPDFRLAEAQEAITRLSDQLHPEAEIRVGVDVRPGVEGRVILTVLVSESDLDGALETEQKDAPAPAGDTIEKETRAPAAEAPTRLRKPGRVIQGSLPLDGSGKGRFRDVEPTLFEGEDLDVPTFLRRGLPLRR